MTAIEAWMLACILFVFGALVEYAVILFRRQTSKDDEAPVRKRERRQKERKKEREKDGQKERKKERKTNKKKERKKEIRQI